jgi:hypothetical protein
MATLLLKHNDLVDLWYSRNEGDKIFVGRGRCRQVDLTILHSFSRPKNCIVVVAEVIFQQF